MQKIKRLDKRRSIIPISDRVKGGNRHWRHLEYEHHVFARIGISQLYILRSCDIHECNHDYCSLSTIDLISTCPWYPQRCIVGPHFQLSFSQLSLYICSTGFDVHFEQHTRPTPGLQACFRPSLPVPLRYRYLETLYRRDEGTDHSKRRFGAV